MINNIVMLATKGDNQILRFGLAHVRLGLVCIAILVVGVGFFTALPAKENYQAVAVSELAKNPKKLYDAVTNRAPLAGSQQNTGNLELQQASEPIVPPAVPAPAPRLTSTPADTPAPEPSRAMTSTPAPDAAAPPAPAPVLPAPYTPPEPEPTPAPEPYYETAAPAYEPEPTPVAEEATPVAPEPTYTEPAYAEPVPSEEPAASTPSTPEPRPEDRNPPPAKDEDPSSGSCQPPACTVRVVGDGNSITPKTAPR